MADEKKVKIACRVVNGTMLQLWRRGPDDGTGFRPMVKDGAAVRLRGPSAHEAGVGSTELLESAPIETEVPKAWADAWFEQNKESTFVTQGLVYVLPEEEAKEPSLPEGEAA